MFLIRGCFGEINDDDNDDDDDDDYSYLSHVFLAKCCLSVCLSDCLCLCLLYISLYVFVRLFFQSLLLWSLCRVSSSVVWF